MELKLHMNFLVEYPLKKIVFYVSVDEDERNH
jgi:hypothetical protein